MNTEPMAYVLRQFINDLLDLFGRHKIRIASNTMTNGFDRGNVVLGHNPACISTIGIPPKRNTVDSQKASEELRITGSQLPYSTLKNTTGRSGQLTIDTIERICQGLNIPMSEFFVGWEQ